MTPHAHISPPPEPRWEAWLSAPNAAAAEIVRDLGYGSEVHDIEHGAFVLADHAALVAGFGAALSETNAIVQRETE